MQNFKNKFQEKTKERLSSVQSCIRTNDIDLWGDGTHLVFFKMLGCFSFGNNKDYPKAVEMWLNIIKDIGIEITSVHVHPGSNHRSLFLNKGNYEIIQDSECLWSDGNIGGFFSEFYVNNIEIGNLVNPMGDSVDCGMGLERICKILGEDYSPTYDLEQFLNHCYKFKIEPEMKGKNHTVKKVLRKWLKQPNIDKNSIFKEWIGPEEERMHESLKKGRNMLRKHRNKSSEWWYSCSGLFPEEVEWLKNNF